MASNPSKLDALPLLVDEVHVWSVDLDASSDTAARLLELLDAEERVRSKRFRFELDRRRFIVAHGALRLLISRYLATRAERIRYTHNAFGKPELSPELRSTLKFNLSHSGGLALVAVTTDTEVGVDVEWIETRSDCTDTARHFFSAAEFDYLMARPNHLRAEAFFSCWTRKEACLKASGEGLATPPDSFTVPLAVDTTQTLAECSTASNDDGSGRSWSMYSLAPAPGYIGALAVEGTRRRLSQRSWQPPMRPPADPGRIRA